MTRPVASLTTAQTSADISKNSNHDAALVGRGIMPAEAVLQDDALWRPWADLPLDLLRDISRRLHATTDYVRFHATCKPWRDTLPPATCYPAFLPWLLAPPDSINNHRKARDVFFSSMSIHRGTSAAIEIWVPDRRWVISQVDGTAISILTDICYGSLTNPLTGSATPLPLPPFSCDQETMWWADHADGVVCGDGTIFLYLIGLVSRSSYYLLGFTAALLHPGDGAWTILHRQLCLDPGSCVAHHDGKIIIRRSGYRCSICIDTRQQVDHYWSEQSGANTPLTFECDKELQSNYLFESRGELLLANVLANDAYNYTMDGLSVSVYALQEAEGGKTWVQRDGRSLADRVVFLGRPRSFAVDAARFGEISGGCAYFVIRSKLYGSIWGKSVIKRCRVFKYSFHENKSELIKQLPVEWDDEDCMWLTLQQPYMASTENIRDRLEHSQVKAAAGGGHNYEQEDAIAVLDGQMLDWRPVRVKFADQNQPHVAC